MNDRNVLKRVIVMSANTVLLSLVLLLCFSITVYANNPVYENPYNIHDAIAYAEKYAESPNSAYEIAYAVENGMATIQMVTILLSMPACLMNILQAKVIL